MSFKKRPLDAAEVTSLNSLLPELFTDFFKFREGQSVVDGPLAVSGLSANDMETGLIVIGDLKSNGPIVIPRMVSLIVTGNLEAESIISEGKIIILGNLIAKDILGDSLSNQVFCCQGKAQVRCVLELGHSFYFQGGLTAECAAQLINAIFIQNDKVIKSPYLSGMPEEKKREVFVPEILDEDGELQRAAIKAHLLAGKPLLK